MKRFNGTDRSLRALRSLASAAAAWLAVSSAAAAPAIPAPRFGTEAGIASANDPGGEDFEAPAVPEGAFKQDILEELGSMAASRRDAGVGEGPLLAQAGASAGAASGQQAPASRAIASSVLGSTRGARSDRNLARAKQLVDANKFREASVLLFQMSRSPAYEADSAQIKYVLGLMLYEMKMNQSAAFVFYDLIRQEGARARSRAPSRYLKLGLQRLALAADLLDSDVLLKYAIKQVDESDFPPGNRDMLYYRMGELKLYERKYDEASALFARVGRGSLFFAKAKYREGLAYAENKQLDRAAYAFEQLAEASPGVVNRNRVNALLGKARALYQKQQWEAALDVYRAIPRDTEQWHEALFEQSWADLRAARLRSSLSHFQSLHSAFYEDFYQPESLILRAIVYLMICRYDEMEKVLELFQRIYRPVDQQTRTAIQTISDPAGLYAELARVYNNYEAWKANKAARKGSVMPFLVSRKVLKEGDVRRSFAYLRRLSEERKRIEAQPPFWKEAAVGRYSTEIVRRRIAATEILAGRQIRRHVVLLINDLRDLFEQADLLKYERLSGKKEALKKEIAGKGLSKQSIEDETSRDYLIQNGYEYWPFKGEYWLDEIGNYHFVGTQACE